MVLGAIISGAASYFGGREQNKANLAISREQMQFQERMSNSSYQRGMADMRLAGLNPILAYKQGGASVPTGASLPAQNVIGPAVSSAIDAMRASSQVANIKADTKLKSATTKTALETARIKKQDADASEKYGPRGGLITTLERTIKELQKRLGGNSAKSPHTAKMAVERLPPPKGSPPELSDFGSPKIWLRAFTRWATDRSPQAKRRNIFSPHYRR